MDLFRAPLDADEQGLRSYMDMLEVLSQNRGLQENVKEAEKMLTQVDIERLPSFNIGYEQGEAEGLKRGKKEGREEGRGEGEEKGKAQVVRRLLEQFEIKQVSALLDLPPEEVKRLAAAGGEEDAAYTRH